MNGSERITRWGWYSIAVNIILIGIDFAIATASGSLAVSAELVHNVVDLFTATAVLIGLKLATRKTEQFPYGLYKVENVIAVGLAIMIFFTAYEIARDALFGSPPRARVETWMVLGMVVAAAIPLTFSRFELRAGKEANSPAIIADAKEYRVHVFTTGVALAALVAQRFDFPIDRIAALIIVVAIAKTGWDLLLDGIRVLLDASLDADTLLEIREIVESEPTVSEIEYVTGRNAGRFRFVEAEISLRVRDLEKAERVTENIEGEIKEAVPHVDRVLIHAEPAKRIHMRYAVPLSGTEGTIADHFGEAPFFGLVTLNTEKHEIEEQQIIANPFLEEERAKGIRVAEWLVERKVDVVLLKTNLQGRGPVYVFRDAAVGMEQTACTTLEEQMAALVERSEEEENQ